MFYASGKNLDTLINRLKYEGALAVECFEYNVMKLNQDKVI